MTRETLHALVDRMFDNPARSGDINGAMVFFCIGLDRVDSGFIGEVTDLQFLTSAVVARNKMQHNDLVDILLDGENVEL